MSFDLQHKKEFIEVLSEYRPSSAALESLKEIPLVIMLGVTASGRNTIINHLVNSGKYHFVVSDTTRPPKVRNGSLEQDGVHYNFRSEEDMLEELRDGKYLEAELIHDQQVSGISINELEKAAASKKIPINEVDVGGTVAIKAAKPDTKFFFIIPPSHKEWLYRLQGREVMSDAEMANRMRTAITVLKTALADSSFTFIVNDSSHASSELIDSVATGDEHAYDDTGAREIAQSVLATLESSTH